MGNDIFVHRVILKYAYNPSKAYRLICQGNIFVSMFFKLYNIASWEFTKLNIAVLLGFMDICQILCLIMS